MKFAFAKSLLLLICASAATLSCQRKPLDPYGRYSPNIDTLVSDIPAPKELLYLDDQYYLYSFQAPDGTYSVSKWTKKGRNESVLTGLKALGAITGDQRRYLLIVSDGHEVKIHSLRTPAKFDAISLPFETPFDHMAFSIMNRKIYAVRSKEREVWELDPVKKTAKNILSSPEPSRLGEPTFIRPSLDGTSLVVVTRQPAALMNISLKGGAISELAKLPESFSPGGLSYYRNHYVLMDKVTGQFWGLHSKNRTVGNIVAIQLPQARPLSFQMDMQYGLILTDDPDKRGAALLRFPISVKDQ